MRNDKSFFRAEAKWNTIIHYGLLLMGLLALLFSLLVEWLRDAR